VHDSDGSSSSSENNPGEDSNAKQKELMRGIVSKSIIKGMPVGKSDRKLMFKR